MKVRNGFVSNSSSSSFIVTAHTKEEIERIRTMLGLPNNYIENKTEAEKELLRKSKGEQEERERSEKERAEKEEMEKARIEKEAKEKHDQELKDWMETSEDAQLLA